MPARQYTKFDKGVEGLKILIKGGRLIDPASGTDGQLDVVIEEGRIKGIGKIEETAAYDRVIHAEGKVVAPGLIDVHVHFREPGFTHKEDLLSGSAAAARGGFTTVVCMANTKPAIDHPEVLTQVLEKAAEAPVRIKAVATVSKGMAGKELTDMAALAAGGAVGFSDDGMPLTDPGFVREAMKAAVALDMPISLHEEEPLLMGTPGINDGAVALSLGIQGAPSVSESAMVARDCMLALDTGAKVHMQHLSCMESVALVRLAKTIGASVTAEVTPQHFALTEAAVQEKGALAKLNPPLRTERDRQAMIVGLQDGTIDMIATDHAPHAKEEKERPLTAAPSGLIGLETALAVGITYLVCQNHLSLSALIEKMTIAPAMLYGFSGGRLAEGEPADLVIFDEQKQWTVEDFASKSSNSPFVGKTLQGKVSMTICRGRVVYEEEASCQ